MPATAETVRDFVRDAYKIVSANSPNVGLHGSDQSEGIKYLNQLVQEFSANPILITVSKEVTYTLVAGVSEITFDSTGADVNEGRLADVSNAWLVLEGVTYPLTRLTEAEFNGAYKYNPLLGLPLYYIIRPQTNSTRMTIYPGASQGYELHVYGKFEKSTLDANDLMTDYPFYFKRFLKLALARELAVYKSRIEAWSEKHEKFYLDAKKEMEAASQINLTVESPDENALNGAYRVRAGV